MLLILRPTNFGFYLLFERMVLARRTLASEKIVKFKENRRKIFLLLEISKSRNCSSVGFLKCVQFYNC